MKKPITTIIITATLLFNICSSCKGDDPIIPKPVPNPTVPNDTTETDLSINPTSIIPTLEWGEDAAKIKSIQNRLVSLTIDSDTLLRYKALSDSISIDYKFYRDSLISASLTQMGLSSIEDIYNTWLSGYTNLSESNNVCISNDNKTLACSRVFQGNKTTYVSVAWTAIREQDEYTGPDFTPTGTINGHDYIDLGTGIGWAIQNVGANSMEDYGNYYMWGETISRTCCWWTYYSLYRGDTSYYLDPDAFYTPYSNISATSYDVARKEMGGGWRMPTRAEISSLVNNCSFKEGSVNGTTGQIVTGPSGKSIFIPSAGFKKKYDITRYSNYNSINLWSSTTYGDDYAYILAMQGKMPSIESERKYIGLSVRGVINLE